MLTTLGGAIIRGNTVLAKVLELNPGYIIMINHKNYDYVISRDFEAVQIRVGIGSTFQNPTIFNPNPTRTRSVHKCRY